MAPLLAIDISTARPAGPAIADAGYEAVIMYCSAGQVLGGRSKDADAVYAASLRAVGLGTGRVWETSAARSLGGGAAGRVDGPLYAAELEQLGHPAGCVAWVNVGDFAAAPYQIGSIHDYYFEVHQSTLKWQVGGYGTRYIIDQLHAGGAIGLWWQNAENDETETGDIVSPNASVYQRITPTRPLIAGCSPGVYDEDVWQMPSNPATPNWHYAPQVVPVPAPAPDLVSVTRQGAMLSDGSRLSWHR